MCGNRSINDFYDQGKVWGEGATCCVKECINRLTGEKLAIKLRADDMDELGRQGMYNELRILQILDKERSEEVSLLLFLRLVDC